MIPHDGASGPGLHHGAGDSKHGALLGPTVDEVPGENRRAGWVPIDPVLPDITETFKQPLQGVCVAVNVADYVNSVHAVA
jgi:hypothetical protein